MGLEGKRKRGGKEGRAWIKRGRKANQHSLWVAVLYMTCTKLSSHRCTRPHAHMHARTHSLTFVSVSMAFRCCLKSSWDIWAKSSALTQGWSWSFSWRMCSPLGVVKFQRRTYMHIHVINSDWEGGKFSETRRGLNFCMYTCTCIHVCRHIVWTVCHSTGKTPNT